MNKELTILKNSCCNGAVSLAGKVGIVNEIGKDFFSFLNRKMSVTALRSNDCSLWVL